jgi:hypothetical protein
MQRILVQYVGVTAAGSACCHSVAVGAMEFLQPLTMSCSLAKLSQQLQVVQPGRPFQLDDS